ncbi:MAG: hypothetical protein K8F52_06710 [Candidatus Scalindua rubra]|uniref:PsbP C-terminal domain-containing protein n=1 Tax=Candidatus Scalindua brodae TaxID=237368 RepID=A0A0B0ENP8_9BACT|nr:MAG: hypothetical protein SCABRO_01526 [Candidatus Scalindua brodae]MBZ0108342.1 hypothetical protein [Candidatus Scalindua rubra]TWU34040.1 hypothetical protein S225a_12970 [Candidatus Brocadiaceae bacterium S225]
MQKLFRVIFIFMVFHCGFAFSDVYAGKYDHNDFSIDVPGDWVNMGNVHIEGVKAAFTKEVDAEITPIILIAIDGSVGGSTIENIVEKAVKIVTSTIPDAKFLFERDVYTGSIKWREIIYQYSDAGYSFQVVQYHTVNNKKHYAFTGQSLQTDFRGYLSDFRKTFNTWKFKAD